MSRLAEGTWVEALDSFDPDNYLSPFLDGAISDISTTSMARDPAIPTLTSPAEQVALFKGILWAPEDDSPRLIYSDWLDEHGEALRAYFIRIQCALARLKEDHPIRPVLQAHESQLIEAATKWSHSYPRFSETIYGIRRETPRWSRGFLEEMSFFSLEAFFVQFESAATIIPLQKVEIISNGIEDITRLAACPHLKRLLELHLSGFVMNEEGACAFANSPHLARLNRFDLRESLISNPARRMLKKSKLSKTIIVTDRRGIWRDLSHEDRLRRANHQGRARKNWECERCLRQILAGEMYHALRVGKNVVARYCDSCAEVASLPF